MSGDLPPEYVACVQAMIHVLVAFARRRTPRDRPRFKLPPQHYLVGALASELPICENDCARSLLAECIAAVLPLGSGEPSLKQFDMALEIAGFGFAIERVSIEALGIKPVAGATLLDGNRAARRAAAAGKRGGGTN